MPSRVTRREALGLLAAAPLAIPGGPVLSVATFEADITPPAGHPLMGGGIAPAARVDDPLSARGFVLRGAGRPVVLAALDWCEVRNAAYDPWRRRPAPTRPG